jgi:hypothetical protein
MKIKYIDNKVTKTEAMLEIALLLIGIISYLIIEFTGVQKRWLVFPIFAVFTIYIIYSVHVKRETVKDYGLRFDNILPAIPPSLAFTLFGIALLLIISHYCGANIWQMEVCLFSMILYSFYGIIQQSLFQGILHRRLLFLMPGRILPILVTTILFTAVHLGNSSLVYLTLISGFFWSLLYQKWPNVITIGISHGLLASIAYPIFIGMNPIELL